MIRWQAEITYRSRWGLIHKSVDLKEIGFLQEVVEEGPHWDTIAAINVRRFKPNYPDLTVEQAEVQTPEMVRLDEPVSLKTTLRVDVVPESRLLPL